MSTRRLALFAAACVAAVVACALGAATDPLSELKSGAEALESKRYAAAVATLEPLGKRLPKLSDYVAWFLASAQFESRNFGAVPKALDPVLKRSPASPLAGRAAILSAKASLQSGDTQAALTALRANYQALPQPQGDLEMALAFAATEDKINAAVYDQRVYYGFPLSTEAAQAGEELARLRTELGENYPEAIPASILGRALKILDAGQAARARKELETLVPRLTGFERDITRVSIGVAGYKLNETPSAHRYLASLEVTAPEADAERLHYLLMCARRLKNQDEASELLDRLGRLYSDSRWRMESLVASGNHYLVENQIDDYEPLYRACYESFPKDPQAAKCHWKVAWGHFLRRRADATDLLRAHLHLFPASESASAALYFLGRIAEAANDSGAARVYYDEVAHEYPNQYYAVLARERLEQSQLRTAQPSAVAKEFLRGVAFPQRARTLAFAPTATTASRIERAHMLVSAGLEDWAQFELRFAAQTEDQPHVMAMELAALTGAGKPDQAIRYIKHYAGSYLFLPVDSAPLRFWQFAFPMPYRADLERFSRDNSVDPFLMAALIRQESEFDAKAVSPSNARGLTQILPSTGRELSRRLKVAPYTTAKLFQPAVNLQLGTFYLKALTSQLDGHTEAALAAYNAGLSRARAWLTWGDFREPAEFVETVPFTETRNYVQTVLRNADVYRRVYGMNERASAAH